MGKFINPKKIKGQDKLNRIKDLMGQMNILTESKTLSELELIKKGPNGVVYGIIRENHDYFIKTSDKTSGKFLAEDFNYVGGLQNKYEERYKSYADAIKHLNMKFDMLNESFGIMENNNIFESDGVAIGGIKSGGLGFVLEKNDSPAHPGQTCEEAHPGQNGKEAHSWTEGGDEVDTTPVEYADGKEILDEEEPIDEKTVLKVDAPPAPAPEPVAIEDEVEVDEFGGEEEGGEEFGAEEEIDVEGDEEEGDEYTKKIQKLTGKVGQMLRDKDEPDSELDKYVINSIVSAIDWEEIDDEDVEDIIAKIEGEDEEDGEGDEFGGEEVEVDLDAEEEIEEPAEELAESRTFTKKSLMESFLKKNANLALKKVLKENQAICEECMGGGCASCGDVSVSLNGEEGWASLEDPMEENLTEDIEEFDTFDDWRGSSYYNSPESDPWDISRGGYDDANKRYFDRHREKYGPFRIKPWKDSYAGTFGPDDNDLPWIDSKNRHLREDDAGVEQQIELSGGDVGVVEEMDVTTALATGQDYLHATGDLDRDGDKIPNRLDLDNNADGSIDHGMGNKMYDWPEHILGRKGDRDSDGIPNKYDDDVDGDGRDDDYVEVGLDDIMGNNPVKEPDVKPPTTTPGTKPRKPRWKEITRPGVDPRPKAEKNRRRASTIKRGMY